MTDSTTRIEEDLRVTRARMDGRLTELQERLTPGQILDDVMAYFRDSGGGDFGRNLVASVRSNPLPAAITGIGLAWLMASGSGRYGGHRKCESGPSPRLAWLAKPPAGPIGLTRISICACQTPKGASPASTMRPRKPGGVGWMRPGEASSVSRAKRARPPSPSASGSQMPSARRSKVSWKKSTTCKIRPLTLAGGRVRLPTRQATQSLEGSRRAKEAGSKIIATMGDNPLLLGAVALGFGALLGALIPQSEQEEAALADAGAKIRETALNAAQGVMDRGSEIADQALAAGQKSAGAHGLSGDTSVGELLDSARSGELLDRVEKVARDTLHSTQAALGDGHELGRLATG